MAIKKILNLISIVVLIFLLGGCGEHALITGYVVDVVTKEPIANARLITSDGEVFADQLGYFKYIANSPGIGFAPVKKDYISCSSPNYGNVFYHKVFSYKINGVYMAPKNSIYGFIELSGDVTLKLFDGEKEVETKLDENHYFYFLDLQPGAYYIQIYTGTDNYSSYSLSVSLTPEFNEYIYIDLDDIQNGALDNY